MKYDQCKTFGEDELSTEEREFRCLRLEQRNTAWSSAQMSKRYQWRNSKILYCSINLLNYLQNRFCYSSSDFNLWERDWVVFHGSGPHRSHSRVGQRIWSPVGQAVGYYKIQEVATRVRRHREVQQRLRRLFRGSEGVKTSLIHSMTI